MDDYDVVIEGQYDLAEVTRQIAGEEAGASEFVRSAILTQGARAHNRVTFRPLPAGIVPKDVQVVMLTDPAPPGAARIWSGAMIVGGTNTAVAVYRKT